MAIIQENLDAKVMRNKMESKEALATKGALYVGTGDMTEVTPNDGGDAVNVPITSSIAPNGADDNGKVLVADASQAVGWRIDTGSFKTGTSAYRKTSNAVLALGQPFLETDTGNLFVGKTGTEKLKDLTLDDCYLSYREFKRLQEVYGVDLVGSENPNALVRTEAARDLNVTVGNSEITSDFDNCYPWSDIEEVTDEFGNVFIKIPKFYSKITKNSDGTYKHQLSGMKHEGFDTLFKVGTKEIDYVMVGKYEGSYNSDKMYSKSGQAPKTQCHRDESRRWCRAHGAGYQQYDFLIDLIIKELWLVEMKTTNCQSIMYGYANNNSNKITTGTTDSVATPSGSPVSNSDGKHACKYRGIENPWGNISIWCDGIAYHDNLIYLSTNPNKYYQSPFTGDSYKNYGAKVKTDGFVKIVAPLEEGSLIQYVTNAGGSATTGYCDKYLYSGNYMTCGGSWKSAGDAGLWCWNNNHAGESDYEATDGGRLCYKPPV